MGNHRLHIAVLLLLLLTSFLCGQTSERFIALERGYNLISNDPIGAIEQFRFAQQFYYSDTIALQIAFLLNSIDSTVAATDAFTQLTSSSILEFRERAHSALFVLDEIRRVRRHPAALHLSATAFNDSHFHDDILWSTLQGVYHLNDAQNFSAVATLGLNADSRSTGGRLPILYSDNVLLLIAGIQYLPFYGAMIDIQGGLGYDLRIQGTRSTLRGDFRAIGSYGTGIYLTPRYTEKIYFEQSLFADAGFSAGYYSRYDNVISYAQGRTGVRLISYGSSAFDIYLRTNFSMDSDRLFYNNIAEAGGGLRIVPNHKWNVSLLLEYLRGAYIGGTRTQSPGGLYYSTIRLAGVIDRFF